MLTPILFLATSRLHWIPSSWHEYHNLFPKSLCSLDFNTLFQHCDGFPSTLKWVSLNVPWTSFIDKLYFNEPCVQLETVVCFHLIVACTCFPGNRHTHYKTNICLTVLSSQILSTFFSCKFTERFGKNWDLVFSWWQEPAI